MPYQDQLTGLRPIRTSLQVYAQSGPAYRSMPNQDQHTGLRPIRTSLQVYAQSGPAYKSIPNKDQLTALCPIKTILQLYVQSRPVYSSTSNQDQLTALCSISTRSVSEPYSVWNFGVVAMTAGERCHRLHAEGLRLNCQLCCFAVWLILLLCFQLSGT